jgi:hypothetical protein
MTWQHIRYHFIDAVMKPTLSLHILTKFRNKPKMQHSF